MTVIAGLAGFPQRRAKALCEQMLDNLSPYADGPGNVADFEQGALGCALQPRVPEDRFDAQPTRLPDGRIVVADVRLDNRPELTVALNLSPPEVRERSDSWLLAQALLRWGEGALDQIVGDYALAVWNGDRGELLLARSPLGARPLFYAEASAGIVFATLPSAIRLVPECMVEIDDLAMAADAMGIGRPGVRTIYRNVIRVEPAHLLRFRNGQVERRQFWQPETEPLRISVAESGERLRDALSLAVSSRLRGSGQVVASQLSAGRDSSAVTITAASLLAGSGQRLLALTGAPVTGLLFSADDDEIYDESPVAARTMAAYPEVEHRVARPREPVDARLFADLNRLNQFPIGISSNLPWQLAILDDARRAGADVLLLGQAGNSTVSVGGMPFLPDLLAEAGLRKWLAGLQASSPPGTGPLLRNAARSLVPAAWYRRLASRRYSFFAAEKLLKPDTVEALKREYDGDGSPPLKSARAELAHALVGMDSAEVISLARWKIDSRDPTADRRVAELCLRLPAEALVGRGRSRPAYSAAFGAGLPADVIEARKRGFQGADWFRHFSPALVEDLVEQIRGTAFGDRLDRRELTSLLSAWPTAHSDDWASYATYRIGILGLSAAASFLLSLPPVSPTRE